MGEWEGVGLWVFGVGLWGSGREYVCEGGCVGSGCLGKLFQSLF